MTRTERQRPAALQGIAGWLFDSATTIFKLGWKDQRRRQPQLRVVETLQLGSRRQLLLVSCRGERFLVGTGAETVQTIVRVRAERRDEDTPGNKSLMPEPSEVSW